MRSVEILVVGAGFAGLAVTRALHRAGRHDLLVIDRGTSVGGTWRDNTYPGVSCDVPSHLYCLADRPNPDWSTTFAPGAEIQAYLQRVAAESDLHERLLLDTRMLAADWDGSARRWLVRTSRGVIRARVLILACGRLTEPRIPDLPGLESFDGPSFHTARWDHSVSYDGRRVAVVGTGASAVQVLPELARTAAQVVLFQRSPAWIVPRGGRAYSPAERASWRAHPESLERVRAKLHAEGEARFAARSGDPAAAGAARRIALEHLTDQVSDPLLRARLTPRYAFGCKRVLLSDTFYPAVASRRVTLEPSALVGVQDGELVAADGGRYAADVLVFATGFATTRQPYADLVTGELGHSLAQHWSAGMTSFASTVVAGFPNLFVLNGPNASLGHTSSVLMSEEQSGYVVRALAEQDRRPDRVLRTTPAAEQAYTAEIADAAARTPWLTGGCHNWYVDERSGRLTLLWPGTVRAFRDRLAATDGSEFG